jgi:hypothetical protein
MFEKIRGDLDRFGDMCGKLRVKQDFADWIAELDAVEKEIERLRVELEKAKKESSSALDWIINDGFMKMACTIADQYRKIEAYKEKTK